MTQVPIQFKLNGDERAVFAPSGTTLLRLLREGVGDTTPKNGCEQGTCGSCSVLIDGELRLSCLTVAETCHGKHVETIASISKDVDLHPLQLAFMKHFASQCGFCTPGMILAAKDLLGRNSSPTREEVIDALSGNICRCTGYEPIIAAVLDAAGTLRNR